MLRKWIAAFVVAPLPAVLGLAQAGFFSSSDGMIHLYRLFELDRAVQAGIVYPRWFPLSGYGYGLPVLNYYPPLSYYAAELFHLAGAGYIESIKLLIAVGFVVAMLSMFIFSRGLIGDAPALVAGIGYAYSPYLLSDAYVRGNFPEFLAMAVAPLALWAFRRIFDCVPAARASRADSSWMDGYPSTARRAHGERRPSTALRVNSAQSNNARRSAQEATVSQLASRYGRAPSAGLVVAAGAAFALVILLHHLTAMLVAALLCGYVLFLLATRRDWRALLLSIAAIGFALVLSAFYWLPSLAELNLVYVGPASVARFLVSRLVTLPDLLEPSLAYVYLPQSDALKHVAGFPQAALALVVGMCVLALLLRGRISSGGRDWAMNSAFFSVVALAALFMTISASAPLWYTVPVLRFMQFPWRFEILSTLGVSFLLGVLAKGFAAASAGFARAAPAAAYAAASLALVALGVANLPVRTIPLTDDAVNLLWSNDSQYVVAQMGWGWTREFVPASVQDSDSIYQPAAVAGASTAAPVSAPSIRITHDGLLDDALDVSTAQAMDLSLHAFYFPGWQAFLDGASVPAFPRGALGLVSASVPAGVHTLRFEFGDTPIRLASDWISLAAALGGFAWLVLAKRGAAVGSVGAMALVGLLVLCHARVPSAAIVPPAPNPAPAAASLDDRVILVGYSTNLDARSSGDPVYLTLYWMALAPFDKNYQVYVDLSRSDGQSSASQDGPPDQGLTPTTRWLPGEVIADRHVVAAAAPGEYDLTAGMYLPGDDGKVDLGQPIDLGKVQVQ